SRRRARPGLRARRRARLGPIDSRRSLGSGSRRAGARAIARSRIRTTSRTWLQGRRSCRTSALPCDVQKACALLRLGAPHLQRCCPRLVERAAFRHRVLRSAGAAAAGRTVGDEPDVAAVDTFLLDHLHCGNLRWSGRKNTQLYYLYHLTEAVLLSIKF